jgi:hypothetical protein
MMTTRSKKRAERPFSVEVKFGVSLPPSSAKSAAIVGMAPHKDGAIVFVINPVPEVTTPCRIVVVSVSGEFAIVDDGGCRINASIDDRANRTAEERPVINRETNSYACKSGMTEAGADKDLRITFSRDEARGYDGGENKYLFHNCRFLSFYYFGYEIGFGI